MPRPIAKWLAASLLGLCLAQPAVSASKASQPEKVFGWVEEGVLMPEKISVKIKMDTGALTSSERIDYETLGFPTELPHEGG
ncbi:hypothetical protein D3C81_424640 [compost metagenome]